MAPKEEEMAYPPASLGADSSRDMTEEPNNLGVPAAGISQEDSRRLFRWNLGLGVIHLVTGIVICIITDTNATVPMYSFFSDSESRGGAAGLEWVPIPKKHFDFPVGIFAGVANIIASIDHLFVSTIGRGMYERCLARNYNPFRWIEYSFSASVMHIMIAQLSGVFSLHLLFSIFGFTFVTMLYGYEQEVLNMNRKRDSDEPVNWRPFFVGGIPHMFGWTIILCFFFQGVSTGDAPNFVWAIIFILFFLDATFPLVMLLQQRGKGRWENYIRGEVAFCILSLTSKQLLAWLNYGGAASL
jgi:hypothetical protein